MDLHKHYESYRASIKKDALEGFAEFTKTEKTKRPEKWPTVFHYLKDCVASIQKAIKDDNYFTYERCLDNHQTAMLAVFSKMVSDQIHPLYEDLVLVNQLDADSATAQAYLDMIKSHGWNWFKFGDWAQTFEDQNWIPRYSIIFDGHCTKDKPYFDADEMKLLFELKPSKDKMDQLVDIKKRFTPPVKLIEWSTDIPLIVDMKHINQPLVRDWALRLFL